MKEKILKLQNFFFDKCVALADYNEKLVLENGANIVNIYGTYVESEDDEAFYFEDLTDSEIDELTLVMENIDADDIKTEKRCSN